MNGIAKAISHPVGGFVLWMAMVAIMIIGFYFMVIASQQQNDNSDWFTGLGFLTPVIIYVILRLTVLKKYLEQPSNRSDKQ